MRAKSCPSSGFTSDRVQVAENLTSAHFWKYWNTQSFRHRDRAGIGILISMPMEMKEGTKEVRHPESNNKTGLRSNCSDQVTVESEWYIRYGVSLEKSTSPHLTSRHAIHQHGNMDPSILQSLRVSLGFRAPSLSSNAVAEDSWFRRSLTANGKLRNILLKSQLCLWSSTILCTHPAA